MDGNTGNNRNALFSLLRLVQPNFRDYLINNNLFGENDFDDMVNHSILPMGAPTITNSRGVLGDCEYMVNHSRSVRGIDFSPKVDHLFCSAGQDGKVISYDARFVKPKSINTLSHHGSPNFTGLKFLNDGYRVALTTSSGKVIIYDVEKEIILQSVEKCCNSTSSRTSIVVDSNNHNLIMTPNTSGYGISQIDIRSSCIIRSLDHIHGGNINDIKVLDPFWSSYYLSNGSNPNAIRTGSSLIMTASTDNTVKIIDVHKNVIKEFHNRSPVNAIAFPNEYPNPASSCLAMGGNDKLNFYSIDGTLLEFSALKNVTRLLYTKSTNKMFVGCQDGSVRMYSRSKGKHELIGEVYKHSRDVQDMAISRNDEYLVTCSTDTRVSVIKIGDPIYGPSEFGNLI